MTHPEYQVELWQQQSWHRPSDGRRYQAELRQNLFGEWVLVREWWGAFTHKRGHMENSCESYEAGKKQLENVEKCRQRRGYLMAEQIYNREPCSCFKLASTTIDQLRAPEFSLKQQPAVMEK